MMIMKVQKAILEEIIFDSKTTLLDIRLTTTVKKEKWIKTKNNSYLYAIIPSDK